MALTIENPETIARLQERAAATGLSVDQIIANAIRREMETVTPTPLSGEKRIAALNALHELQKSFQEHRPVGDDRSTDEIVGYDEAGLPS